MRWVIRKRKKVEFGYEKNVVGSWGYNCLIPEMEKEAVQYNGIRMGLKFKKPGF